MKSQRHWIDAFIFIGFLIGFTIAAPFLIYHAFRVLCLSKPALPDTAPDDELLDCIRNPDAYVDK